MSRILVDQIRSNSASADAITLDGSGNLTIPGNITCSGNASVSGTATGFGGGVVKQVQYQVYNPTAAISSTSTTFVSTGLTKSITPTSASNKIKIVANLLLWWDSIQNDSLSGGAGVEAQLEVTRTIGSTTTQIGTTEFAGWCSIDKTPCSFVVWDSTHNSTAAITYTVNFRRRTIYSGNSPCKVHHSNHDTATLTLTEYEI